MLSTYAAKYRSLKAPRKLVWRPALGSVSLDLFIGDQEKEFTVSGGMDLPRAWYMASCLAGCLPCHAGL